MRGNVRRKVRRNKEVEMLSALEYFKIKCRMVNADESGKCTLNCYSCPLGDLSREHGLVCSRFERAYPEKAIELVEKWDKEHPVKTIMEDFFEKYPNAPTSEGGEPKLCPSSIGYDSLCDSSCYNCWRQPVR